MRIATWVFVGLVAGAVVGALAGPRAAVVEPVGTIFLRLLRMVVVPLVGASLFVALAGAPEGRRLSRLGLRAAAFVLGSLLAALVIGAAWGLALAGAMGPAGGAGGGLAAGPLPPAARPSLVETLVAVVPENIVRAAAEGDLLQVLFVAVALGLAAGGLAEGPRRLVVDVAAAVAALMTRLVAGVLLLAPFGVFALVAAIVGRSGLAVLRGLGGYVLVVLLALATHVVVTYGLVLLALARQPLGRFWRAARPALLVAFGTCSSAATLPVSLETMQKQMGLSSRVATFVLPLGAAVGRDGSGIYQIVSVLFVAQAYGRSLGPTELGVLVVTAVLSSLAVASVPAASFVNLAVLLEALGLPLEGAALVLGVERILDMVRTSVNVVGQLVGATWVAAAEGEIAPPAETGPPGAGGAESAGGTAKTAP